MTCLRVVFVRVYLLFWLPLLPPTTIKFCCLHFAVVVQVVGKGASDGRLCLVLGNYAYFPIYSPLTFFPQLRYQKNRKPAHNIITWPGGNSIDFSTRLLPLRSLFIVLSFKTPTLSTPFRQHQQGNLRKCLGFLNY